MTPEMANPLSSTILFRRVQMQPKGTQQRLPSITLSSCIATIKNARLDVITISTGNSTSHKPRCKDVELNAKQLNVRVQTIRFPAPANVFKFRLAVQTPTDRRMRLWISLSRHRQESAGSTSGLPRLSPKTRSTTAAPVGKHESCCYSTDQRRNCAQARLEKEH